MNENLNFRNGTKCTFGDNFASREMTAEEIQTVKDMVGGYDNVTVTSVHVSGKGVGVQFACNYLSRAKFPNNHREYREFRSADKNEWKGWF